MLQVARFGIQHEIRSKRAYITCTTLLSRPLFLPTLQQLHSRRHNTLPQLPPSKNFCTHVPVSMSSIHSRIERGERVFQDYAKHKPRSGRLGFQLMIVPREGPTVWYFLTILFVIGDHLLSAELRYAGNETTNTYTDNLTDHSHSYLRRYSEPSTISQDKWHRIPERETITKSTRIGCTYTVYTHTRTRPRRRTCETKVNK